MSGVSASSTALQEAEPAEFEGTEPSLFDGINTTLPGIATLAPEVAGKFRPVLAKIDQQIAEAQRLFDPAKPELTAPPLRLALSAVDGFIHELEDTNVNDLPPTETFNLLHELHIKRVQLNNALVLAHGLVLDAVLAVPAHGQPLLTTQEHFAVATKLTNDGPDQVTLGGIRLEVGWDPKIPSHFPPAMLHIPLDPDSTRTDNTVCDITGLNPTEPYFSRPNIEQPFYEIAVPALRNAPATPAPLDALITLDDHGTPLQIAATVAASTGDTHPNQPAVVVPPVSVSLDRSTAMLRPGEKSLGAVATISSEDAIQKLGGVKVLLTPDPKTTPELLETTFPMEYQKEIGKPEHLGISVDTGKIWGKATIVTATVSLHGRDYFEGYRPVGYPGLTYTNYYTPSTLRVVPVDVTTAPNLKVAYLPGTGDNVPAYLPNLGITPTILALADLTAEHLKQYDALILGVRAYSAHPELAGAGSRPLIDYARHGGVVIIQYNNGHYGDAEAPYPISTPGSSGDHAHDVVDETAPVTILAPDSPLLTWPNKITPADFSGWVEERGHAFAGTWSPEYTPLLETHDPGQPPQKGGLLIARVGSGSYIYCGLALYRQFPEGVPGAYRLLANLISAAKNPGLQK
jgi:hypothetical protein